MGHFCFGLELPTGLHVRFWVKFRDIAAPLLNFLLPAFGLTLPALLPAVLAYCFRPLQIALLLSVLAFCNLFGALASAFGLVVPASGIAAFRFLILLFLLSAC